MSSINNQFKFNLDNDDMKNSSNRTMATRGPSLKDVDPPILSPSGPTVSNHKNVIWRIIYYLILEEMDENARNQRMDDVNPNLNDIYEELKPFLPLNLTSFGRNQLNSFTVHFQGTFSTGFVCDDGLEFSKVAMKEEDKSRIKKVKEKRLNKRQREFMAIKKVEGVKKVEGFHP